MGDSLEDPLPVYVSVDSLRYDPVYHKRTWRVRGDGHACRKYPGKTRTLPLAVYSEVAGGNMDRAAVYVAVILVIAFLSVWVMNMMAKTEQNIKI